MDSIRSTTGYEYVFQGAVEALKNNKLECKEMTHKDTLLLMKTMDDVLSHINYFE